MFFRTSKINIFKRKFSFQRSTLNNNVKTEQSEQKTIERKFEIPKEAEVVIIGGGSAGCHTLYHLAKRGVKAVLLERAKLTAGTTWHTAGLVWRLRPNDVDIQLLANSRNMLRNLEQETGLDPGWIQNGGIFIAHSKTRLDEYKRLSSIGTSLGIENYILSPKETTKYFPLLDPESFIGALYSPGDGVVDPAMLCAALKKSAIDNGATIIEDSPALDILVDEENELEAKIIGVSTTYGKIKTDTVVNATGVWGRDLAERHGSNLPLIPMRHAYIVSESIPGVRGLPNIRDHDYSIYLRIQGESICMGGYENNPILLESVPKDFHFGLYDLDWSVFDTHVNGAVKLCPAFGKHGIKSTICGPESFTPDHKPLMGPDPHIIGLFHNCGFNSAGMMFGGGCGEQIALWIINGQPDLPMFSFDVRRFNLKQSKDIKWATEKSHESYVKNYSIVFPNDQPLAGRNLFKDPFHEQMVNSNAFMEEKQGWERPGFFLADRKCEVAPYDWYGSYDYEKNSSHHYVDVLEGDMKYEFSDHHNTIGSEALSCRNNVAIFNLSYFCKLYLDGPEANEAAKWIFSGNVGQITNKALYTCVLNDAGGVEADLTVTKLGDGTGEVHSPHFESRQNDGYYIVSGGASGFYTFSYIQSEICRKGFVAELHDVTENMGILSIQGKKSREILQKIIDIDLSNESLPPYMTKSIRINDKFNARILRISFVGELGYELHIPKEYCPEVYEIIMKAGKSANIKNAGYRALYSLSHEKGYHLWGFDLRSDDTPIEANLGFTCRRKGSDYKGREAIERQRNSGIEKRLVYFTLNEQIPIWGLEGVYRNGKPVGHIRRGDYAYFLGKPFGSAYIHRNNEMNEKYINDEYINSGKYQIDIMGKLYDAECHLRSPFDPENKRIFGNYK